MKKILSFLLALAACHVLQGQTFIKNNTPTEFRAIIADTLGIKGDTIPVPAAHKNKVWLASKDDVIYVWSVDLQKWVPAGSGGVLGVTSVNASISGALAVSGGPVTSSGTLAFTWTGTTSQYVRGNGSLSSFATDVQTVGDARYAAATHTHVATDITNLTTYVRNLFSGGSGIDYNAATGTFSWPGTGVITSLNGLSASSQTFGTGTTGTDFNINSVGTLHTFNLPTVSGSARGLVTSALYNTWNAKQDAITLTTTGTSGAATLVGSTLNIPNYAAGATPTIDQVLTAGSFTTQSATVGGINIYSTEVSTTVAQLSFNQTAPGNVGGALMLKSSTTAFFGMLKVNDALSGLRTYTFPNLSGTVALTTDIPAAYTDADARAAISLTTTGTSGAATYNSSTGVLNIPNYATASTPTWQQVLTAGSTLTSSNTATLGTNSFTFSSTITSNTTGALRVNTTGGANGLALRIDAGGRAIFATPALDYTGIEAAATGLGNAFVGSSQNSPVAYLYREAAGTNTVLTTVQLSRFTTGTAANGIGQSIDFYNQTSTGSGVLANQIVSKWTTATNASASSQIEFWGKDNGAGSLSQLFTVKSTGQIQANNYTTSTAFTGTAVGTLQIDASGNFIVNSTTSLGSGATPTFAQVLAAGNTANAASAYAVGFGAIDAGTGGVKAQISTELVSGSTYRGYLQLTIGTSTGNFVKIYPATLTGSYSAQLPDKTGTQTFAMVSDIPSTTGMITSAGDLTNFFTTTESSGNISFSYQNAAAFSVWGNFSNASAQPTYNAAAADGQVLIRRSTGLTFQALAAGDIPTLTAAKISDFAATARTSISLTTTGTSGAATYNNSTGVLNIPQYGGGTGTVTAVTVTTANGVSATVANQGTTPALTFTLGAITPSSVVTTGNVTSGGQITGNTSIVWKGGQASNLGALTQQTYSTGLIGAIQFFNTVDAFTGTINTSVLTANRTWTFPDLGGTIALTTDITSGARTSISLTTTGTSGAATYNNSTGVLNIPNYGANIPGIDDVLAVGQTLTTARTITTASGSGLTITGNTGTVLAVNSTSGNTIMATTTGGNAPLFGTSNTTAANGFTDLLTLNHTTTGTATTGLGVRLTFGAETSDGTTQVQGYINTDWTNATTASRVSRMAFQTSNATSLANRMEIAGSGQITFNAYTTSTAFTGTPVGTLQVDASGNVIVNSTTSLGGGGGTVTAVSVASANGFAGSSSGGTTPALTISTTITGLLKGNGTAISAASASDIPDLSATYVTTGTTQNISGAKSFTSTTATNWTLGTGSILGALGNTNRGTNLDYGNITLYNRVNAFNGHIQQLPGFTANRSYELPDKDGTFAMLSDITFTQSSADALYQPLDADLTSLAGASGTNTIYYRSGANTWSAVTIGTNLTFSGGTLSAAGGGMTNPMTTTGDIIYGGASGTPTRLAGSAGFLKSTGAAAPTWSALASGDIPDISATYVPVSGTTTVSGQKSFTLSITANNGLSWKTTGQAGSNVQGQLGSIINTNYYGAVSLGSDAYTFVGRITIPQGASGLTADRTYTFQDGSGTIAFTSDIAALSTTYQPLDADLTAIAALSGTNNIYYRSAANTWTSVTIGTGLSFSSGTLSSTVTAGMTNPMTTTGDIIYGGASGAPTRLGGSAGFLKSTGAAAPTWSAVTKSDVGLANVENTALSTWAGSTSITTLGTITAGTWNGTDISNANVAQMAANTLKGNNTAGTADASDLSVSQVRTMLGFTTVGTNLTSLANPSAITFLQVNADNSVSALTAANFRTAIGVQTDFVNVRDYGAVGDGSTNDYTAISNAIATGKNVFFPEGRYFVSSAADNYIIEPVAGQRLFGVGYKSVIITTDNRGLIGVLLDKNDVVIENLRVRGSGRTANLTLQSLIMIYEAKRTIVRNVWVDSCGGNGTNVYFGGGITVSSTNSTTPNYQGAILENIIGQNNYIAIYLSRTGEYVTGTNWRLTDNEYGAILTAGNYAITASHFSSNNIGIRIASDNNSGHGFIGTSTFNHNSTSFQLNGLTQGHTFSGCGFYYGNASITSCTGAKFVGCDIYGGGTYTFTTSAKTLISNCRLPKTPTTNAVTLTTASGEPPIEINNLDF